MSIPLPLNQIPLKKEKDYFTVVAVIAALCWLLVIITIIGPIYGLMIGLFVWLAHGLVIAHLESESVLVTQEQMPGLYATYREVVEKLELKETPPLYIVQSHGLLNAFATRRSGRHFVVVYSDMLEACGEDTPQIRFLLGHELGHVRSNHLLKKMFCLPGTLFPLIGSAYSRACEGTCDRYGAYASGDLHASAQAMLILAGGKSAWQVMDPQTFSLQYKAKRGFFVSWHELISGYPTLSQRAYNILSMDKFPEPDKAPRNPFAYFFALFSAGGKQGSAGNLLLTIGIIALFASIALPAIKSAQLAATRARQMRAYGNGNPGVSAFVERVTFCSSVINSKPVDSLTGIPASLDKIYVYVEWGVQQGPHDEVVQLLDDAGNELQSVHYAFISENYIWHTWVGVNLAGINPRPRGYVFRFYVDGKLAGTQRIPAEGAQ
jgi:Zn-dependent protease with chaperone function